MNKIVSLAERSQSQPGATQSLTPLTPEAQAQWDEWFHERFDERFAAHWRRLPQVKSWTNDGVAYMGEVFSHDGSLFQARQDTGSPPPGAHWACMVRGASMSQCDGFDAGALEHERVSLRDDIAEAIAEVRTEVETKFAAIEERLRSTAGSLPQVKIWSGDGAVAYEGELFSHVGSLFQAREDTGAPPPGPHWVCVARGASIGQLDDENDAEASEDERRTVRRDIAEAISELRTEFETRVATLEERLRATGARLPPLKVWTGDGGVAYEGELFSHDGSLWQARQDTGQPPGGAHWTPVARGCGTQAQLPPSRPASDQIDEAVTALRKEPTAGLDDLRGRIETFSGKLPIARAWTAETIAYEGSFVVHDGACWQARRDTARCPGPGEDWVLVARAGRDGASASPRGEWDAHDAYSVLDIVTYRDCSYIATRADPGRPSAEGAGWQMLAGRGPQGNQGQRGHRGDKGSPARATSIRSRQIDAERYRVSALMSDGTVCGWLELRGLFEHFLQETGTP
jgi:hypothetical protein